MRLHAAAIVAMLAGLPALARAERAAVAAIDLGPKVPAYLRAKAAAQIADGLAASGYEVVPAAQVAAQLTGKLAACRTESCAHDAIVALHVDAVIYVDISSKDDSTLIGMRLFEPASSARVAESHDVCELCGEAELVERLGVAASALHAQAAQIHARQARLGPTTQPASPSLVPAIAAGAVGVIAVGAGAYLLAIDGRGTCSAGDTPAYPAAGAVIRYPDPSDPSVFVCRDLYKTKALGVAGIGVGIGALALGAVLVVRSRHHARALEIAPTAGGATVKASFAW